MRTTALHSLRSTAVLLGLAALAIGCGGQTDAAKDATDAGQVGAANDAMSDANDPGSDADIDCVLTEAACPEGCTELSGLPIAASRPPLAPAKHT